MLLSLPITVPVSKNKNFSLNLNQYRNAHYQTLNKAKHNFEAIVKKILQNIPFLDGQQEFEYILYPKTKRELDVANICSIVDKFFSDSLVNQGKLKDDNFKYLPKVTYRFGEIDPHNPRCDVMIKKYEQPEKEPTMQIILTQDEIFQALENYVYSQINVAEGQSIDIDMKAGRGDNGFTATLDIRATTAAPKPKPVVATTTSEPSEEENTSTPVVVEEEVKAEIVEKAKPAPKPVSKPKPVARANPFAELTPVEEETEEEAEVIEEVIEEEKAEETTPAEETPAPKSIFNFGAAKAS